MRLELTRQELETLSAYERHRRSIGRLVGGMGCVGADERREALRSWTAPFVPSEEELAELHDEIDAARGSVDAGGA